MIIIFDIYYKEIGEKNIRLSFTNLKIKVLNLNEEAVILSQKKEYKSTWSLAGGPLGLLDFLIHTQQSDNMQEFTWLICCHDHHFAVVIILIIFIIAVLPRGWAGNPGVCADSWQLHPRGLWGQTNIQVQDDLGDDEEDGDGEDGDGEDGVSDFNHND